MKAYIYFNDKTKVDYDGEGPYILSIKEFPLRSLSINILSLMK